MSTFSTYSVQCLKTSSAMRKEKEERGAEIGKEEAKTFLSIDMLLYYKNHKVSTRNLLDLIGTFRKPAGYKSTYRKGRSFSTYHSKLAMKEIRSKCHSQQLQ